MENRECIAAKKEFLNPDQVFLEIALDGVDYICSWALLSQAHASTGVALCTAKFSQTHLWVAGITLSMCTFQKVGDLSLIMCCWCDGLSLLMTWNHERRNLKKMSPVFHSAQKRSTNKGWQTGGEKRGLVTKKNPQVPKKVEIASQKE